MKKLVFLCFLIPLNLFAQDYTFDTFYFNQDTSRLEIDDEQMKESLIIIQNRKAIEYIIENDRLLKKDYFYNKVLPNDDQALESYKEFYISLEDVVELIDLQFRTISKNGKITVLDSNNIKEVEDLETYGNYKVLAIEGLEKGSILEYFFIKKKTLTHTESGRMTFQSSYPVLQREFEIVCPQAFVFKFKSYNGLEEVEEDTLADGRTYYHLSVKNIPKVEDEKYATVNANKMRVEYKYRNNKSSSYAEQFTYADFVKTYYEAIYDPIKKNEKNIKKLLSQLKLKKLETEEKIKKIEYYLKTNFVKREDLDIDGINNLDFVLKNRVTHNFGMLKLFAACFEVAGIDHQVGFTCSRYDVRFDPDFESWNYLEKMLIYFPDTKRYLMPTEALNRYGLIDYDYTHQKGLFMKSVKVGDFKSAVPKIRDIPFVTHDKTYSNMYMDISLSDDLSKAIIKKKYEYAGYYSFVEFYDYMSEEEKDKLIDEIIKQIGEDAEIISKSTENTDPESSPVDDEPFTINAEIELKSILERAGDNILFNIGKLIGEQVEMYQEKERQFDVEIEYPHSYIREIKFKIPENYEVKGLDKLKINIVYGENGKNDLAFICDYKIEDNQIIISIEEYYTDVFYPKSRYEEFREVINAAADFNKITLILEKVQ